MQGFVLIMYKIVLHGKKKIKTQKDNHFIIFKEKN